MANERRAKMRRARRLEAHADELMAYLHRHWFDNRNYSLEPLRKEADSAYREAIELMLEARP